MRLSTKSVRARLLIGASVAVLAMSSGAAVAQERSAITIAPQSLTTALQEFGSQTSRQVMFSPGLIASKASAGVSAATDEQAALAQLLQGTGLSFRREGDVYLIVGVDQGPQGGGAAGGGADVDALIVTAQKREENIQDVPIAISAFSQEDLTRSQIAGGPDLITQVPNMTFTKTNFSSYSVQLRGIGTQAISATTDPAVAIAFNNTPFIRNRFFEQEFYDLQRVEVLRGPQGTLYGRNATAGVVNIISAKPSFRYEAKASGDVSNYNSSRIEGMVNIPLVEDMVALRLAGAWTKRDGYATNEISGNPIDGRDLWSTRLSLRFDPTDGLSANLIWEHFQEDDDRLRSGKQLCKKHVVSDVDGLPVQAEFGGFSGSQAQLSQGCIRTSLYAPEAFQTPNGYAVPYYHPLGALSLPTVGEFDPYRNNVQSRDLRVIESTVDPDYRAKADLAELQISFDVTDTMTLASETAYSVDTVYSMQDFNRFNTAPGAWDPIASDGVSPAPAVTAGILDEDGVFCDPQIGCSDRLVAIDISTAKARQFSQEFRLSSDFEGPFNFSLGANFLRADSEDKYYVFINALTMFAAIEGFSGVGGSATYGVPYDLGVTDNMQCLENGKTPGDPSLVYPVEDCIYIDPNPIGSLNDQGHNYFLSKNPYKLISYAVFGEAYYNINETLKLTAGLRWTIDKKEAPRVPSWTLAGQSYGYPVAEVVEQEWREPTGRLTLDWKPVLPFTDETMLYASYSHGYKAGGANPPRYVYVSRGIAQSSLIAAQESETRPKKFNAEFVDAFEIGSKNVLADGAVTLNIAAFYYDYKDYQISEIVDRSAFNRNFDAEVWGVEFEADWRPLENLKLGFKGGYEKTRIADGERAIDLMDRTAGHDGWVVVRPFPTFASSCILPSHLFAHDGRIFPVGNQSGGTDGGCEIAYIMGLDPITGEEYIPNPPQKDPGWNWYNGGLGMTYVNYPGFDPHQPEINNGEGFLKELGGNELPNAPNWTATITADYTLPLPNEWLATLHTDLHWQSESYWRVFQDHDYSKLDEYFTMNLAAIFTNEEAGWNVMAYIKNVTDETAITGAFLNSDDTGLTTNVFLTEPRLYGLRVTKTWTGGSLLGSFGSRHDGPYPFAVELGGQVQRHDAHVEGLAPSFADELTPVLDILGDIQDRKMDWGDGREVKVAWRPDAGPWKLWAGLRAGKTNARSMKSAQEETDEACGAGGYYVYFCTYFPHESIYVSETNWSSAEGVHREAHTLVDFAVGRDLGIGGLSQSSLNAGLRYAELQSTSSLEADAIPDWFIPEGFFLPGAAATHTLYRSVLDAERSFEGMGPVFSWDAARRLIGATETGYLNLDWSVGGGLLFGKQKTSITGDEVASTYEATGLQVFAHYTTPPLTVTDTAVDMRRSQDLTVVTLAASLGLSYEIDRVKVSGGYRWERYFDAIDAGFAERKDADRTIDGPYFKIAVGFGG